MNNNTKVKRNLARISLYNLFLNFCNWFSKLTLPPPTSPHDKKQAYMTSVKNFSSAFIIGNFNVGFPTVDFSCRLLTNFGKVPKQDVKNLIRLYRLRINDFPDIINFSILGGCEGRKVFIGESIRP